MKSLRWNKARITTGLAIALLSIATCINAQEQVISTQEPTGPIQKQQTPTQIPDPNNLRADWWHYFEDAEDVLATRIKEFKEHLQKVEDSLAPEVKSNTVIGLFDEIRQSLDSYLALKSRTALAPIESPTVSDQYTLRSLLELARQIRDTELEADLERDELLHRQDAIRLARKKLDNLKANYFALSIGDPGRFTLGLTIIRDRFQMARANEELRLLAPQVEIKGELIEQLREALDSATSRLTADASDIDDYERQLEAANAELASLGEQAAFARLRGIGIAETPADRAQSRLHAQRLIDFDVRIAVATLAQTQAKLSLVLATRLSRTEKASTLDIDPHESLREYRGLLKQIEKQRSTWRNATDRERTAAATHLSLTQGVDAKLADIHRLRIRQADDTLQVLAELREALAQGGILAELTATQLAQDDGWLGAWLIGSKYAVTKTWDTVVSVTTGSLFSINETPVTIVGLLRILLILAIAWWISKVIRGGLERLSTRTDVMNRASLYTLGRLLHYVILTLGVIIGLSSVGLDFTKLALFVSALGVGLGFGLQAIFSNFVAGLIILFEKSLKVGDFVELESGVTGEVREINIRSTQITTNDNIDFLVPNSEFVNGRVINWTLRDAYRRIHVPFGVAYGSDKVLVETAVLEAAREVKFTLRGDKAREPQVWLVGFGDSSLNFELVAWLRPDAAKSPSAVHAAFCWAIETALKKHGIEIPFPQRDLHVRSVFGGNKQSAMDMFQSVEHAKGST